MNLTAGKYLFKVVSNSQNGWNKHLSFFFIIYIIELQSRNQLRFVSKITKCMGRNIQKIMKKISAVVVYRIRKTSNGKQRLMYFNQLAPFKGHINNKQKLQRVRIASLKSCSVLCLENSPSCQRSQVAIQTEDVSALRNRIIFKERITLR